MATPWSKNTKRGDSHTFRKFEEGKSQWGSLHDQVFVADKSHRCPTYVLRTPPCQGSCPSGHEIRGWLQIVRGIETPPADMSMQEYAFLRNTDSNPFPSMMGRVCPAPCQDGCNRNEVEGFVGINSVEQYIGDTALEKGYTFAVGEDTGKKVAVIGGGVAGLSAAYQLRRLGHGVTVFERDPDLGGMARYGIPNYRIPRDTLKGEIDRIVGMGVEVRTSTAVGSDVSIDQLESDYDAILWTIGCQNGRDLPVEGWADTPNCVSGVAFLKAFNEGRMKVTAEKVICIGGGDTSIDVVSVTRRLGYNPAAGNPEDIVLDTTMQHEDKLADEAKPAEATLTSLFTKDKMMAAEHEIHDAIKEGVEIYDGVMPLELIIGDDGRATALKVCDCTMDGMTPIPTEGTERVLEADLIVAAIGQSSDMTGVEDMANDRGLIDADATYRVPGKEKHFVAGDIVRPHLLTTAIGQAAIAVQTMDAVLKDTKVKKRPKVDVNHFNLLEKLQEAGLSPEHFDANDADDLRGTGTGNWAVHNFEDRAEHEIIKAEDLFLGYFEEEERHERKEDVPTSEQVLHHFHERVIALPEEEAVQEAGRCMSCGLCFECDNCVIFCPQDAVFRVRKDQSTTGRYVDTDYNKCIGCHICADVCPTGYIDMGMGE